MKSKKTNEKCIKCGAVPVERKSKDGGTVLVCKCITWRPTFKSEAK